jgi:hypothetical protein
MTYPRALALLAVAYGVSTMGCGAQLGPDIDVSEGTRSDGAIDSPGASSDARPCAGGNSAQVGPDGTCFVHVTTPVTYAAAKAACVAMNAHLAYVKSATIDTFAEQFVGTTNTWIGGNDLVTEGSFAWDDGTAFAFTAFGPGEPNAGNGYEEDCVIIAGAKVSKGWDDRPCDASEVPTSGVFAYLCNY